MLEQIDWTRRWYDSVRPAFERIGRDLANVSDALNAGASGLGLRNGAGMPLRFVPQSDLPEGQAYEEFIGSTGCVPTRDNLHDFFNGLVWLTFPRTKQQLNALQAAQIAIAGVGKSRGPARDAATIFDENAALLVIRDSDDARELVDALRGHRWTEALFERRAQFGTDAQLWLFGHALMEKLVAPRKAITAHTRVVVADDAFFSLGWDAQRDWLDEKVAAELARDNLTTACFTPLPILGVPGWYEGQDDTFYADATVFRPKRMSAPS
ncbi:MAG TPA: DUF3025 domain-containing protein [Telluria sp.]